jgi:peptidyl-tRNA hydrolase, PTH1 family
MFYIVGLGNPGTRYTKTRHNVGWLACDALAEAYGFSDPVLVKKYRGRVREGVIHGSAVTLLYPETFMNSSGLSVRAAVPKDAIDQLVVIYDEVDLPVGTVKISFGNGAGGHNGVASVIESLGTKDFVRIRIGVAARGSETGQAIRPAGEDLANYVLGTFTPEEQTHLVELFPQVTAIVTSVITEGKDKAMNRYN